VVEAPKQAVDQGAAPRTFDGPNAQKQALSYAYEAFGGARFFPF